jgi:4-hydroxy-2-oxovalerate aldolase
MKVPTILETTLRDGSYAINYQFSSNDTAMICSNLEQAGFNYIELGHGVGLGASNRGYGKALHSDEEYLKIAQDALNRANYGMFCIPGIATLNDISMAQKYGMNFIRIGTNVTEVNASEQFIKEAKNCGMYVCANYMKSYVMSPTKFAQNVLKSEKWGVDLVYVVDSAGGMFPDELQSYYEAIRKVSDIPLGFHGHNNLGLAVSNSLKAVELGFDLIDSSLQGIGRSSGNASTELLVMALLKKKYQLDIDFLKVLEIGQKYIKPLLSKIGDDPLDIITGYADFHSSYMHYIQKYSVEYQINPLLLIIELTKLDKINCSDELVKKVASTIPKDDNLYLGKYGFYRYVGGEQDNRKR